MRTDVKENSPLRPTFLVIGAQKGGTTALFNYLARHSSVVPPRMKEIDFFSCPSRYSRGYAFYHSHFAVAGGRNSQVETFDVSPSYITSGKAAGRIFSYDPKMKLIVLLRDPIRRCYSAWQMHRIYHRENREWFFDWMHYCDSTSDRDSFARRDMSFGESFEDDILSELEVNARGERIEMPMLLHGFYYQQLHTFLGVFPSSQVFVESSEQFLNQTISVLQRIERFVGLPGHSWVDSDVKPIFVGRYDKSIPIPAHAMQLLKGVYGDHNEALFSMLGRKFRWL